MAKAEEIIIDEVGELGAFESSCQTVEAYIKALKEQLASETANLGGAWQDEQYRILCSKVAPILSECDNAIAIINGSLVPFIAAKKTWAEDRSSM